MPTNTTELKQLHAKLTAWIEQGQLPGAAILAMQGNTLLDDSCFGHRDVKKNLMLNTDSLFRLASATKIFTSAAFLTLVDQARVQLKDPVAKYLPEYNNLRTFTGSGDIQAATKVPTVEDLLRHSNGFAYGDNEPYQSALAAKGLVSVTPAGLDWSHSLSLREWAYALSEVPMEFEPGADVTYGLGHDLLGAVIETVTGQSVEAFFTEALVTPLGLKNTFFTVPAHRHADLTNFYSVKNENLICIEDAADSPFHTAPGAVSGGGGWDMLGNGGLVSNSRDFSRLLQMIMNRGSLDGVRVLNPESATLLTRDQTASIGEIFPGNGYSYGLAYSKPLPKKYQDKSFGGYNPGKMWWGGSTNTHFWFDPKLDFHGIFLTHTFPFRHLDAAETVDRAFYNHQRAE